MPQQLPVANRRAEGLGLALALDLEGLLELELVREVGRGVRLVHVRLEHLMQ